MEATLVKKLVILTLASAALFATIGGASAQITIQGPRYESDRAPRYDRDHDRRNYRNDNRRHDRRVVQKCRPHYTVQDGVCKPYRGY